MVAKITGAQIRAGRAFLRWTIDNLAKAADIGNSTVQAIERADGEPRIAGGPDKTLEYRAGARDEALTKIAAAFAKAGVTFQHDGKVQGIRWRTPGR